jgi:hypothetical protein
MVMDASGNVGIGTASPSLKFDVRGPIYQRGSTAADTYLFQTDGTNAAYWQLNPLNVSGSFGVASGQAIPFIVGTNNTERMRITSVGSIQTPTQPLLYLEGNNANTINFTAGQQLLVSTYYTQTTLRGDISWNSTTGRVTANTTGQYMLTFAGYENGASGRISINRSGSALNLVQWNGAATRAIAFPVAMTAGNYIDITAEAFDLPQLFMGLAHTHFSLYLIG